VRRLGRHCSECEHRCCRSRTVLAKHGWLDRSERHAGSRSNVIHRPRHVQRPRRPVEQNLAAAAHRPPRSRSVPICVVCRSFSVGEIARSQNARGENLCFLFPVMLVIPIQSPGLLLKQEGKIFILFCLFFVLASIVLINYLCCTLQFLIFSHGL
jgi:hypothetical protein